MSNKPTGKESTPIQEYVIRVTPKTTKKYNVMRFSEADSIDFNKWKSVKLDREFNLKEYRSSNANDEELPKFGAGSVFGAEQREESRKKRYQKYASRHRANDQPWILNVKLNKSQQQQSTIQNGNSNIKQSSSRKFRGIREGGVTDNTSYYVFFQAHDGAFEAFPVSEWYKFAPIPKFKALTAEEAEEQFLKRDKILNFFTVMDTKKKTESNDSLEDGQFKSRRTKKDFKTSDMDDWGDFGGMSDGSGHDSGDDAKGKKKGKKRDSDDNDSEAKEESDEGDFDQREVDYMSDESSSDDEAEVERLNKELQGVEDEDALRQLVLSDEESDEEENKSNAKDSKETTEQSKQQANGKIVNDKKSVETIDVKVKKEKKANNSDSSDSDDSDLDEKNFQSSIFLQKNESKSAIKKELKNENSQQTNPAALKRKLDTSTDSQTATASSSQATNPAKRPKVVNAETSLEETVKRYLTRKPITTTELIKNVKKMKLTNSKEDLVAVISQILKKLNPQTQKISDKLYLFLNEKKSK